MDVSKKYKHPKLWFFNTDIKTETHTVYENRILRVPKGTVKIKYELD